jgi:hypothetical protein
MDVDIFYNAEEFIRVLRGEKKVDEVNQAWPVGGCPHFDMLKQGKVL